MRIKLNPKAFEQIGILLIGAAIGGTIAIAYTLSEVLRYATPEQLKGQLKSQAQMVYDFDQSFWICSGILAAAVLCLLVAPNSKKSHPANTDPDKAQNNQ
ncbi:hypothetical protein HNP46_004166 [Pseudomonas nitritireducens]|uniref:Uncharacterized protein n=1 Tax=Pseudomonas nitroreducens TaxID=46680 RepID=A0A7W7KM07_PSENT|nr:hypothetical protein [Pseudomonas nitritireducens]MBB4865285.1 hypothetical protein [Pseudomonas nitritireducens]